MRNQIIAALGILVLLWGGLTEKAHATDKAHETAARSAIERGVAFLKTAQNEDGSWTPQPGPAITAMAVTVLIDSGLVPTDDPQIEKALAYILTHVQADGGIHTGILGNYNTAICLGALDLFRDRPGMEDTIKNAQDYLRGIQWDGQTDAQGNAVDESHPFFGGAGYGRHGRPDMSNTQLMLQGLYDSGLDCKDPAFTRAIVFISRCQGIDSNTLFGDMIENDGGFIYATSINKDLIGVPESKANPDQMDEALTGQPVSGLRAYGSMTYAGFKSYLYALLDRDDPRVIAALTWIGNNYTLDRNPGLPEAIKLQGLYYYYMTFARALDAYGQTTIQTADGEHHDWANDLIDALASRQQDDGSWTNDADRWMEGDPSLVTCYALIALEAAVE
jgi:prenyltransferase/squalene oxidase-like repeat protein